MAQQITLVFLAVLSAVAVAAIPGGSLPLIAGLLVAFGIPPEGIGIILGVDGILDMTRTMVNVGSDLVTTAVVDAASRVYPCVEQAEPPGRAPGNGERWLGTGDVTPGQPSRGPTIVATPSQITFRHIEASPAVEARVREPRRSSAYVQRPHTVVSRRRRLPRIVIITRARCSTSTVQVGLPGEDVVVDMERPHRDGHEDVYVVIRDAFDAAKRQLQQRMASLRGDEARR